MTGWGFCSHNNYKQIKVYIPSNLLLIYSNIEYNNRRYFQGVSALCLKLCSSHLIISWRSSRFLAHCNILPLISSGDVLDIMNFHLVSDGGCAVWRNLCYKHKREQELKQRMQCQKETAPYEWNICEMWNMSAKIFLHSQCLVSCNSQTVLNIKQHTGANRIMSRID